MVRKFFLATCAIAPVLELGKEPGAGVSPMALGGCQRDLHHPGDLGHGQAGEEAELDQLGLRRVFLSELVQDLVQGLEVFGWFLRQEARVPQLDTQAAAAMLATFLAASVLDQDRMALALNRKVNIGR